MTLLEFLTDTIEYSDELFQETVKSCFRPDNHQEDMLEAQEYVKLFTDRMNFVNKFASVTEEKGEYMGFMGSSERQNYVQRVVQALKEYDDLLDAIKVKTVELKKLQDELQAIQKLRDELKSSVLNLGH